MHELCPLKLKQCLFCGTYNGVLRCGIGKMVNGEFPKMKLCPIDSNDYFDVNKKVINKRESKKFKIKDDFNLLQEVVCIKK